MRMSEQEVVDHLTRLGLALDPTLTVRTPAAAPGGILEAALLVTVRRLAIDHGWAFYHTHDSRRSDSGFPDCVLAKPGRLLFVELKSERGKLTQEQAVWLSLLQHSVPGVEVYTWRPADLPRIRAILTHIQPPQQRQAETEGDQP